MSSENQRIFDAANALAESDTGVSNLATLHKWFNEGDGLRLDESNKSNVVTLLTAAWSGNADTTLKAIASALQPHLR